MNSRLHQNAERDNLFGPGIILKHPEAARPQASARLVSRAPEHGKPARAKRFLTAHLPSSIAALASMLYGARYDATTQTDTIGTAQHAFDSAFVELTQRWDQVATALGLSDNAFLTAFVGFLGMVVALFFAVFAGIGAVIVHGIKLLV